MVKSFKRSLIYLVIIFRYSADDFQLITQNDLFNILDHPSGKIGNVLIFFLTNDEIAHKSYLSLMKNFYLANEKLKLFSGIFLHLNAVHPQFAERYFLHYYTLPKIANITDKGHTLYNGGSNLKAIESWVARQKRLWEISLNN